MSGVYKKRRPNYKRIVTALIILICIIAVISAIIFINHNLKEKDDTSSSDMSSQSSISDGTSESSSALQSSSDDTDNIDNSSSSADITEENLSLGKGESQKLTAAVTASADGTSLPITWESSDEIVATVAVDGTVTALSDGICTITAYNAVSSSSKAYAQATVTVSGNAEITEPTYIDGIIMANKTYALPADYAPGIDPTAQSAFDEMQENATALGLSMWIASSFRSYEDQERIYNSYVDSDGKELADTYSSRPGYSDHQTGLAFDLNSIDDSFADTPEYEWLKDNAHKYGFIIRYPKGKESITGYKFESWHIRYVGVDIATDVYNQGVCLEEYLGITSAYINLD